MPKADWNYLLIRSLWPALQQCSPVPQRSVEHEETWLILAGFFFGPGSARKETWPESTSSGSFRATGCVYPGKRIQLQRFILWRRVAGGLSSERQEAILAPELPKLRTQNNPPAELVRLAGSLERISPITNPNSSRFSADRPRTRRAETVLSRRILSRLGFFSIALRSTPDRNHPSTGSRRTGLRRAVRSRLDASPNWLKFRLSSCAPGTFVDNPTHRLAWSPPRENRFETAKIRSRSIKAWKTSHLRSRRPGRPRQSLRRILSPGSGNRDQQVS